MANYQALLCDVCGTKPDAKNCVKCGRDVGSEGRAAFLCDKCGESEEYCIKCGAHVGSEGIAALICFDCGYDQEYCAKCGKAI